MPRTIIHETQGEWPALMQRSVPRCRILRSKLEGLCRSILIALGSKLQPLPYQGDDLSFDLQIEVDSLGVHELQQPNQTSMPWIHINDADAPQSQYSLRSHNIVSYCTSQFKVHPITYIHCSLANPSALPYFTPNYFIARPYRTSPRKCKINFLLCRF